MSKQTINIGASPNDGTGTPLRTSFDYTNQNFTELYTALGGGVGLPGATTQVIFNDGGTNLAGDAGLVYNKTTDALTVAGLVTAGSATITGNLTVDSNTFVVTASTDTVCIGATTTDSKFRVLDANYNGLRIGFLPGTSNYNLYDATVHEFRTANVTPQQLYTFQASSAVWYDGAGGTRMTLDSTGLGIGVSPTYKIDVSSSSNIVGRISSSNVFNTGFNITNTTASTWSLYSFGSNDATLQNSFGIYHQNGTSFLQITQAGNVGIGVTPSAWGGTAKAIQIGSYSGIYNDVDYTVVVNNAFFNGTDNIYRNTAPASQYYQQAGSHVWRTAPSGTAGNPISGANAFVQAMTLDANGRLLLGKAASALGTVGIESAAAGYIQSTVTSDASLFCNRLATDGETIKFYRQTLQVGNIAVTTLATTYNSISDYRLKEAVQPLVGGLARVSALKPSIYKWKVNGSDGEGFLAHELASVVSAAVTGEKDAVNEDGSINAQSIDMSRIVPILVAAIQELTARVQTLEAR